jgi:hypothetical protein
MCDLCVSDEACAECGAGPGQRCEPFCTRPYGPNGPHGHEDLPYSPILNRPRTPQEHELAVMIAEHPQVAAVIAALADTGITATLAADETGGWHLTAPHGDGTFFVIDPSDRLPENGEPIRGWQIDHYKGIEDDNTTVYIRPAEPDPAEMAQHLSRYRLWCPRLNATSTARTFIDYWDTFTTGDLEHDFTEAVKNARWADDPGGGSLANKDRVTLITDEILDSDTAARLARELLDANDPRIADPRGPVGAIRTPGTENEHGWILFGWAPIAPFPPFQQRCALTHR